MTTFTIVSTLIFGSMYLAWNTNGTPNFILKASLFGMAVWGTIEVFTQ